MEGMMRELEYLRIVICDNQTAEAESNEIEDNKRLCRSLIGMKQADALDCAGKYGWDLVCVLDIKFKNKPARELFFKKPRF